MSRLREYLTSYSPTLRSKSSNEQPLPAANFIDLSIEDELNNVHRLSCCPKPAPREPPRRPKSAMRAQLRGVSWLDVGEWELPGSSDPIDVSACQHCNMLVRPAPSLLWHERLCALNSGKMPESCELCGRMFYSMTHARNHCMYGCSPSVE